MNDEIEYQPRIVAFIDVLGFSELVGSSEADATARLKLAKLIDTNKLFERFFADFMDFAEADFFSDSFVLSMREDRIIYLIREVGYLCRHLLLQGFPCRGSICVGSLFHTQRIIVGPALVKAYQLEKSVAIYPRVILGATAMEKWHEEFSLDSRHSHLESLVKRDRDGQHFIDIFSPFWFEFIPWHEFQPTAYGMPTNPVEFLKKASEQIDTARVANAGNAKVLAKYEWLAAEIRERA